jgi:hypothetical protein
VAGALDDTDRGRAAALHIRLEPLTLQQVVVHTAGVSPASEPSDTRERTSSWTGTF